MKKSITIILTFVIVLICTIPVFAAETKYDVTVRMPEVFYYDSEYPNSLNDNLFSFSFVARNLEEYRNVIVEVDFNKDVLEIAQWSAPDNLVNQSITETETGMRFNASFFESFLDRNDEANKNTTGTCSVLLRTIANGKLDIKITATATCLDGSVKELDFLYPEYYEEIVDVKNLDFLMIDEEFVNYYYAVFEGEITVAEVVEAAGAETAVVINSEKEIFKKTEKVPNGIWIATMYNGFVVDKMQICVKGDVNCDGRITAADARLALRRAANIEKFGDEMKSNAADVNNINGITAADARLILRKAAGLD